jgi:hypothetical protein
VEDPPSGPVSPATDVQATAHSLRGLTELQIGAAPSTVLICIEPEWCARVEAPRMLGPCRLASRRATCQFACLRPTVMADRVTTTLTVL